MEDWEKRSLAAFRAVAREIRASAIVTKGLTIKHYLRTGSHPEVEIHLLPSENFLALCVAVRKVYMQEGPAHFYKVHKIIGRYDAGEYRTRAAAVRDDYQLVLRGTGIEMRIGGRLIGHEELFDSWLNGHAFHQDAYQDAERAKKAEVYNLLTSFFGAPVEAVVQKVALQLAGCVLELDDVIADWLKEERLPRIAPPRQGSEADA